MELREYLKSSDSMGRGRMSLRPAQLVSWPVICSFIYTMINVMFKIKNYRLSTLSSFHSAYISLLLIIIWLRQYYS